ncbi:MAG: MarR family winged helix-turn-helix transcriptional regulator [Parvibaculaceae bacterium]
MTRQTGLLMAQLLNRFMWFDGALQSNLEKRGWGGVRRLESMTMMYVQAGITRPSELARLIGVTRQSMNTALRELEEKKLVRLAPDPDDKRCKIVEFDPAGEAMRAEAQHVIEALEALLDERLGAGTADKLAGLLVADWGDAPLLGAGKVRDKKAEK